MMRNKVFLIFLFPLLFLTGCALLYRQEDKPVYLAILVAGETRLEKVDGLKRGLEEIGWNDSKVKYEIYNAENDTVRMKKMARLLLDRKPDLVIGTGVAEGVAIAEAMKEEQRRPVVLIGVTSPQVSGIATAYRTRGIPVTGVENGYIELTEKRLELLRLLFPNRDKTVVLYDPGVKASELALKHVEKTAQKHGYVIETIPVHGPQDIERLYEKEFTGKEAIITLPSHYIEAQSDSLVNLSLRKKTPIMGLNETEVKNGYAASYGTSYEEQGYQAARLVLRMLRENAKGALPFEMPDTVQLKINAAAVHKIGETFSKIGISYGDDVLAGGE
jgi:putative ABC transport system substrate-binding protein